MPLKLIGNYLSPYTRRVAVSMNVMGIPFEYEHCMVFQTPEIVSTANPGARIPTLVLEDGEAVYESTAILDCLDEMAGPEKALIPPAGKPRRDVQRVTALAIGATERAQWAFYEVRFHPEDKVHQPWIDHNENRCMEGLAALNDLATKAGDGWLAGTDRMSQADISTAIGFSFTAKVRAHLPIRDAFPALAAFTDRCEALEEFSGAPIPQ